MKKRMIKTLLLTALFSCMIAVSAKATTISFNVLDNYIEVGGSFNVEVFVYDDGAGFGDLFAFGFDVDPLAALSKITYTGFDFTGTDYDDGGSMGNYVGGLYNDFGNADSLIALGTMSFMAASAGTDTLYLEGLFDAWDHGLFWEFADDDLIALLDITVNPIPEPGTMLLLGFGLAGLVGFRKKFKK